LKDNKFKKCNCSEEYWEVIIVDRDENFNNKTTIYYHCDKCGYDWYVIDFFTKKVLYKNQKNGTQQYC